MASPADTWIERLRMTSGEVRLQGTSGKASDVLSRIDSSTYFSNARFVGPVIGANEGEETFTLKARYLEATVEP